MKRNFKLGMFSFHENTNGYSEKPVIGSDDVKMAYRCTTVENVNENGDPNGNGEASSQAAIHRLTMTRRVRLYAQIITEQRKAEDTVGNIKLA